MAGGVGNRAEIHEALGLMAWIKIESPDIDRLEALMIKRAYNMVNEAVAEGQARAEDYAAQGGRHRKTPGRYSGLRRVGVVRVHHATGAQKARMCEHVLYHRFIDFFGEWVLCLFVAGELAKILC